MVTIDKGTVLHRVTAIAPSFFHTLLRKYRTAAFLALLILAVVIPLCRFCAFLLVPAGNGKRVEVVEVGRGSTLRALSLILESRGVVSSGRLFTLYARLKGGEAKVKAGVYQFNDGMRPAEVLAKMLTGDVYQRLFALPEGYSMYQVAEMLEKRGIFAKAAFLQACHDQALLAQLGVNARSAEGYLFPGSYNILPGRSERDLVREMVQRQRQLLDTSFAPQLKKAGLPLGEVLTLASMVEKEAVLPAEKPVIAAVFSNRISKGMRLQSDPTALYGVRAFAGKVSRDDILRPTPYNTYLISGLPPGPIGNPGSAAIEAVLSHPKVPYLYFVARGDGSHQFSSDLAAHNSAVRRFLRSSSATNPGAP